MADRPPLVLASGSPRRRRLLEEAGIAYVALPVAVDEDAIAAGRPPTDAVVAVAAAKADAAAAHAGEADVLAADTVVVCRGVALGKPTDRADAFRMLRAQSGQSVEVVTGVVFRRAGRQDAEVVTSVVHLREFDDTEIDAYLSTGAADDKAGGLEIQGAAARFVVHIEGSTSSVFGLPMELVTAWMAG